MIIRYVSTNNGDDSWDGETWATAKKTLNGVKAVLDSDYVNTIYIEEGSYDESVDFSSYVVNLIGHSMVPTYFPAPVNLYDTGGGTPVLKIGGYSLLSGILVGVGNNQTGLYATGTDKPIILNNIAISISFTSAPATALVVDTCIILPKRVMLAAYTTYTTNTYLLNLVGRDSAVWLARDIYFLFMAGGANPFPESQLWKDDIAGGSLTQPYNCAYIDFGPWYSSTVNYFTTPDKYPTSAAKKDPAPIPALPFAPIYDFSLQNKVKGLDYGIGSVMKRMRVR